MSALPSALRLVVMGGASRNHRVGAARQVRERRGTSVPNANADRSPAEQGSVAPGHPPASPTAREGRRGRLRRCSAASSRWRWRAPCRSPATPGLVVTHLNYLLAVGPCAPVRELLDRTWFDVDPGLRRDRLVARHVPHGRSPAAAEHWVPAPTTATPNSSRPPALAPTTLCGSSRGVDADPIRRPPRRSGRCASPGPRAPARTGRRCPPAAAAAPCAATPRSRPRP